MKAGAGPTSLSLGLLLRNLNKVIAKIGFPLLVRNLNEVTTIRVYSQHRVSFFW